MTKREKMENVISKLFTLYIIVVKYIFFLVIKLELVYFWNFDSIYFFSFKKCV